jgi:hypothetical protein
MFALSHDDPPELAETLEELGAQVCELSIMAPDTYGQPFTMHDLAQYAVFRRRTRLPLVVPTQHRISAEALPDLAACGIEGVMLGTIVCGDTPQSWRDTFRRYRDRADAI